MVFREMRDFIILNAKDEKSFKEQQVVISVHYYKYVFAKK